MKLSDTQNSILMAVSLLLGTGAGGVAVKATGDAGEARDSLREWTLSVQRQVNAQNIEIAELRAWRDGFQAGYEKGRATKP